MKVRSASRVTFTGREFKEGPAQEESVEFKVSDSDPGIRRRRRDSRDSIDKCKDSGKDRQRSGPRCRSEDLQVQICCGQ